MADEFKCEIQKIFNNCPKPSGWFGCFATSKEKGKIKLTGTVPFIPHEGMVLNVNAELDDKDNSWIIVNAVPHTKTMRSLINYLSGPNFPGIGYSVVQTLYNQFGDDILTAIANDQENVKRLCNLNDRQIEILVKGTNTKENELRQKFPILTDTMAKNLIKIYKNPEMKINTNPYIVFKEVDSFTFDIADEIALTSLHWSTDNAIRIKAHIEHSVEEQLQYTGGNYIDLSNTNEFLIYKDRLEQSLRITFDNNLFYETLMNESDSNEHVIYIRNYKDRFHLYSKSSWKENCDIQCAVNAALNTVSNAEQIITTKNHSARKIYAKINKDYKTNTGYIISQEQMFAINHSINNQISVITGGPGRGKTATINNICVFWKNISDIEPMLFAPTGRAAANMRNYTGLKAYTIAKLKIMRPCIEEHIKDKSYKSPQLPLCRNGLAIIDECSMVSTEDMACILYVLIVLFNMQIILVGDKDQLPSINYGKPFDDIIQSGKVKTSYLTTCFRSEVKLISDNCDKIIISDTNLQWSPEFLFLNTDDETSMTTTLMQNYLNAIRTEPIENVALLCGTRKGIAGTVNMNIQLQNYLNPENQYAQSYQDKNKNRPYIEDLGYPIQETFFGDSKGNWTRLRTGDRIMCTKNNYDVQGFIYDTDNIHDVPIDEDMSGIVNGDAGKIIAYYPYKDKDNPAEIVFRLDDKRVFYFELSKENLNTIKLTLAYAMTFHKTQGCEYTNVFIAIQNSLQYIPNNFANRNMLYTGVSRAKRSTMMMGSKESLYKFIETPSLPRNSTLAQEL